MRAMWVVLGAMFAVWGCADGGNGSDDPPDAAPVVDSGEADSGPVDMAPMVDAEGPHPGLTDPSLAREQAPETFSVRFETTAGEFIVDVTRSWAPLGADRFYNLARIGFYDDCAFFRVLDGFVAQTGLHGDPLIAAHWLGEPFVDDPVMASNTRGTVTYATSGPDTRRTQIFFNFGDNVGLDGQGFSPFGEVRDMTALDALYSGYGDGPPQGGGPDQRRIQSEGNPYLRANYPELDYIVRARVVE